MKKIILFLLFTLILVGCNNEAAVKVDESSSILVEKQMSNEPPAVYEVLAETENEETIQDLNEILDNIEWETDKEVNMEREPDYKLNDTYHIWVGDNNERLTIINTTNSNYSQMPEDDSEDLYKLMTGKELDSYEI